MFANMFTRKSMPPEALMFLKKAHAPTDVWDLISQYNLAEDQWKPVILDTIEKSSPEIAKKFIEQLPFTPTELGIRGYLPSGDPVEKGLQSIAAAIKYPSGFIAQQKTGISPEPGFSLIREFLKKRYDVPELSDVYKAMAMEIAPIDLSRDITHELIGKAPGLISLRPPEGPFREPEAGGVSLIPEKREEVVGMSIGSLPETESIEETYKREKEMEKPFIELFGAPKRRVRADKQIIRMIEMPPGFEDYLEAKSFGDELRTERTVPEILVQYPIGRSRIKRFLTETGITPKRAKTGRPLKSQ
jgi:hypothetical protein